MKQIAELELDGYAIGGLAVGEPAEVMYEMISEVEPYMPKDKIRYLMGVGTPGNMIEAVSRGVDLFDCVPISATCSRQRSCWACVWPLCTTCGSTTT